MIERRTGKRFNVDWPVRIESASGTQVVTSSGALRNISSGGASMIFTGEVCAGMRVDLYIKLPSKNENWMKYTAEILRIQPGDNSAAVRFDGPRPHFTPGAGTRPLSG